MHNKQNEIFFDSRQYQFTSLLKVKPFYLYWSFSLATFIIRLAHASANQSRAVVTFNLSMNFNEWRKRKWTEEKNAREEAKLMSVCHTHGNNNNESAYRMPEPVGRNGKFLFNQSLPFTWHRKLESQKIILRIQLSLDWMPRGVWISRMLLTPSPLAL